MNLKENYKAPTPIKWRKIGDAIMVIATGASTGVMGLPISEHTQLWLIWSFGVIALLGKVITNLFKEDDK